MAEELKKDLPWYEDPSYDHVKDAFKNLGAVPGRSEVMLHVFYTLYGGKGDREGHNLQRGKVTVDLGYETLEPEFTPEEMQHIARGAKMAAMNVMIERAKKKHSFRAAIIAILECKAMSPREVEEEFYTEETKKQARITVQEMLDDQTLILNTRLKLERWTRRKR